MRDLAVAIVGAMDGVALLTSVRGEDQAGPYRALKVLLLSFVVLGYLGAGKEPPLTRLLDLVSS
jgi:hypothetical protein